MASNVLGVFDQPLPITLIYIGGLKPLQSAVTLASIPLLIIFGVMVWGLKINLKKLELSSETRRSSDED